VSTYHGNPDLKCALITRAEVHRDADRLRQSFGYFSLKRYKGRSDQWKGCAIGCLATPIKDGAFQTLMDNEECQEIIETDFGLPKWLVDASEAIFEQVTARESKNWPRDFADAIPVGIEFTDEVLDEFRRTAKHWSVYYDKESEVENSEHYESNDTHGRYVELYKASGSTASKARKELIRWLKSLEPANAPEFVCPTPEESDQRVPITV